MSFIQYKKEGQIAHVMLNRSDMNPVDFEMVADLHEIWRDFQSDKSLRVAILGSTQKNFSAGFDIRAIKKMLEDGDYAWSMSSLFGDKRAHQPEVFAIGHRLD